jgi:prepilin peptidase CpaA
VTAVASVYDLRFERVPNALTYAVLIAAPIAHFVAGAALHGFAAGLVAGGWSLAGAALCGAIPWICWRFFDSFGGGDVKLLAAIGAVCLPRVGIAIEFYALVVGSVFGLGRLAWEGTLFRTLGRSLALAVNPLLPKAHRRAVPREQMTWMRFAPATFGASILCALSLWASTAHAVTP